jgi:hypothetical protein
VDRTYITLGDGKFETIQKSGPAPNTLSVTRPT